MLTVLHLELFASIDIPYSCKKGTSSAMHGHISLNTPNGSRDLRTLAFYANSTNYIQFLMLPITKDLNFAGIEKVLSLIAIELDALMISNPSFVCVHIERGIICVHWNIKLRL